MLQAEGQPINLQAPDPLLDPARLAALKDLDLLSSPPQDSISKLNRLASQVLGVPISALSLISWDRQISAGSNDPDAGNELIDTPLSHSFCQHVVRSGTQFVVENAREHPLVRDNGAIDDYGIQSYAGVPIRLADGECVGAFCACDLEPREWSEQDLITLRDLASVAVDVLELHRNRRDGGMRDTLTGLPRRALFTEHVQSLIDASANEGGPDVVMVAVDLKAFRLFNEAWGHETGDKILAEVARRLRETVGSNDLVCRPAGDEFLVAQATGEAPDALIGRIRHMLSVPEIRVEGVTQPVNATFAPAQHSPGTDAAGLIDDTLTVLAGIKKATLLGPGVNFVGPARRRLRLRNAIVGAERRGELSLAYQPLVDLRTNKIHSLEALLRWDHPELGSVSPRDFIPVAESTGAIVPIGEWVLRKACHDLAGWRSSDGGDDADLTVAVNVAPEQVRLPSFDAAVAGALADADLPPSALALEITERTILEDRPTERRTIEALQHRGVDLHLDDFGTGYSSLGYLTRFPLDVLKIDRVFVARLGLDDRATALVEGIVAMAHSLGLETVAEGIEHEHQRDMLTAMGCDYGQGFYFARPCPGDRVPELLSGFDA